jgi:hypothetical protein
MLFMCKFYFFPINNITYYFSSLRIWFSDLFLFSNNLELWIIDSSRGPFDG